MKYSDLHEYKETKQLIDTLEKKLKKLRPRVLDILESEGEVEGYYISEAQTIKYDEPKILEWIQETYPAIDITQPAIDWDKFESKVKLGEVDINKLPSDCYIINSQKRILKREPKDENQI